MSAPRKAKGPDVAPPRPLRNHTTNGTQFSAKSTATEAQRERILQALKRRPQTTCDLRKIGIFQAPARVMELRALGHKIETARVTLIDPDGFAHPRAARYCLITEQQGSGT